MKFSTKLREHMKRLGLAQAPLAERLGVHQTLISLWLAGKRQPQTEEVRAMADLFGVTCDYLLDDSRAVMEPDEAEYDREVRKIARKIGPKQVWEILMGRLVDRKPAEPGEAGDNPIRNTRPDDGRRVVRPGPAPTPPPSVPRRRKPGGESA